MRLLAAYLISSAYSPRFTVTSSANVLLVTAFAAITALTENVSSEISNYIEYDSPAKEDNINIDSQSKQLVEKSSEIATSSIKHNDSNSDSDSSRRARYLRAMPPSMGAAATATYGFERRSSAAAAAAAAAAADEDLRKFGRIMKYRAVPLDGRKYPATLAQPQLSRRPHIKSRYRPYSKDKIRAPISVSANHYKHKWPPQLPHDAFSPYRGYGDEDHENNYNDNEDDEGGSDAATGGDYAAFTSDDLTPYEDFYEDEQSQSAENDHSSDHKKKNTVGWFLKTYRDKFGKEREPAAASYEDVEPALSLEHAVGKRIPFTKYNGGNFESYAPYKKHKFTRGRGGGEPNSEPMEWNSHIGEKQAYAAGTLSKYRRLQRPQSLWPAHSSYNPYKSAAAKYSPFEDDTSHRFKLDNSPRFGPAASAVMDAQSHEIEKRERENALKAHLYRRRHKLGDQGRFWQSPSPSASPSSALNEDELTSGSRYESVDLGNDQENAVSITQSKRPQPSLPVQEDDVIVYSSRYRNKQAAAVAAAQRVLDTRNDENYDSAASATNPINLSRLSVDYHNRHRSRAPESAAASSTKQRKKFATFDHTRKSNGYASESDVDTYDAPPASETDDDLATNESYWPQPLQKSNHAAAAALSSSSTPSSVSISRPASFSFSSYNKKSSIRRASPTTTTTSVTENTAAAAAQKNSIVTTTPAVVTETYSDPDFDFDSAVPASDSDSNRNGNSARFEINPDGGTDRISASELIAYMSASPSEPVVHKQDRFANANEAFVLGGYDGGFGYGYGYPFVRTFSEQREKLTSNYHKSPPAPSAANDQDFEINLDQYSYRRRKKRRRRSTR